MQNLRIADHVVHMMRCSRRRPFLWLLGPVLLFTLVTSAAAWWRSRWEHAYDQPIYAAAERYDVDPALVKAIVWRESKFKPDARGAAGELGLMQLREDAAREWADAERLEAFEHEHCLDPVTNTLAGTFYLKKLLLRFAYADDPRPFALAAYNAGRGNALKWSEGEAATNSAAFVARIGFPATRAYVEAVIHRSKRYGH